MSAGLMLAIAPEFAFHGCERDQELREVAEARLRHSAYLELRAINCEVSAGVLTLQGTVSSYYLRQVAQSLVLGLEGIDAIDNCLEVMPARPVQRRCAAY